MSDCATKLFPREIHLEDGSTLHCFVDCFDIKQGPYTLTDRYGGIEVGTFVNNLEEGDCRLLIDGVVRRWGYKHEGGWNGPVFTYAASGVVQDKTNHVHGSPRGGTKAWDPETGNLVRLGTHDSNLHFTGIRVGYHHSTHSPRSITFYKKDQPFGLEPFFDPRGVVVQLTRYDDRGVEEALTSEDQAILKVARLFEYKKAPAYTIETAEQRRAVEDFQRRYPKSLFANIFRPQPEQPTTANRCIQDALAIPHLPEVICQHIDAKPRKRAHSLTIADPLFGWLPSLARVRG